VRILLTVAGGTSHLYPIIPLAWAFRAAGHEVRLGGKAMAADYLLPTGLPVVVMGGPPLISARDKQELVDANYSQRPWPENWPAHPELLDEQQVGLLESFGRYTVAVAEGMVDDQVEFCRRWRPDLIIHDTLALGAQVAGALLGVPTLRYTHGSQDAIRVERRVPDGTPLPEYVKMFDRFGVDPPAGPGHLVDTLPPSMEIGGERPSVKMRWVAYNGPGEIPAGLSGPRARPRVAVTWGVTMASALGSAAAGMYRDVITPITEAGAEVLVLAGASQLAALDAPPDGVRYLSGAPLNLVLPYCDAIMHHGGDGTAMAAACLAVPQLATSHEPIDDHTVARLAATGAAIQIRYQDLAEDPNRGARVRACIEALLTEPRYADGARALRAEIEGQPSPAEVVPVLAALSCQ
jgi:UDP:flavonoid glycosyltransferase YjiC (YdhE family)